MKNSFLNKKNKIFIFVLLILFLLVFIFLSFYLKNYQKAKVDNKRAINLAETLKNINLSYKSIFLQERGGGQEDIKTISSKSLSLWENFAAVFRDNQPEEYKRTRDWDKKITQILRYERKAVELAKEGRPTAAREEIIKSNNIFKAIKKENNILDISDEMLALYDEVLSIAETASEEKIQTNLAILKYKYTKLKEYDFDERYRQLFSEMEKSIAQIDKGGQESDIQKEQEKLAKLLIEAYMNY